MMIKANGEFLDFDGDMEIESQIKLFEEISTSNGDFSYDFDLPTTSKNFKALGLPFPDTIKTIYQGVPAEVLDDSGFKIHRGSLQVNKITDSIKCTFYAGNTEWFGLLSQPMSSLPLYKYDVNLTTANIQTSWTKSSGLVFPILDTGALVTRSFSNLKVEDFAACFYVKTLFKEIFNAQGIKIEGDLLKDDLFNTATMASNSKSKDEVNDRTSYVRSNVDQPITSFETILFQDETTFPYQDGSKNNYNNVTGEYTADVKMRVNIEVNLKIGYTIIPGITIAVNAIAIKQSLANSSQMSLTTDANLNAGDVVTVIVTELGGTVSVISGSTFKVTPIFVYRVFGKSSVPNWTQLEFVSNIIRLFNILPSYNSESKTLTLNLFNKIKEKTEIDISNDVTVVETDFIEFVSHYSKKNYFRYQESEDEDLREYNISNFVKYGDGLLEVDNNFIGQSADVVESDFTAPITYLNGIFDMSMERFNFVETEEVDDKSITSVTDSSGTPRFNMSSASSLFSVGDLVKIETGLGTYDGEWIIKTVTSTYIEVNGPPFESSQTGTTTLLRHKFTTDDNAYLFINVPNLNTLFFSSKSSMLIENTSFSTTAIAYFNLLSNGREINAKYKQSLSFGEVNNPLSYQKTLLETYWGIFSKILADPVLLRLDGFFNRNKFKALKTFLHPVRIKTNQTNNLYYLNRISNYKSSSEACEVEAIKL